MSRHRFLVVNIQKPSQYLLLPLGEGWDEGIK